MAEESLIDQSLGGHGPIDESLIAYRQELARAVDALDLRVVDAYVDRLFWCWTHDRAVFFAGNGGSALTADHHITDLLNATSGTAHGLRALSLVANLGVLTATANDLSFADVFTYQLEAQARPGDLLVALSCSGTSPNVVAAAERSRHLGIGLVSITGNSGELGPLADVHLCTPSTLIGVVEDVHLAIGHMTARALRERILCR